MTFVPAADAIDKIRAGQIVVVVDDEDRENEGDLTIAADKVTPETINFMAGAGRGLICLALSGELCDSLALPLMSPVNSSRFGTAFCESFDAREGTTTGISARDRSLSILKAIDPECRPFDLSRPGHMFPLRARNGGVLERRGQTEAAVDLARLAGLSPAGVICEVMNDDGTMARVPDLERFCRKYNLVMTSVAELVRYRLTNESTVRRESESILQTEFGVFRTAVFRSTLDSSTHLAVISGETGEGETIPVHVHVRCRYGESLGSVECNCGRNMQKSLRSIGENGRGIVLYLYDSGRPTMARVPQAECSRNDRAPTYLSHHILAELGVNSEQFVFADEQSLADAFGMQPVAQSVGVG